MFPVGPFVDARYEDESLPLARQQGVGSVCFKTFASGKLLGDSSGYGRPLAERSRGKLSSGGDDAATPLLPRLTVDECVAFTLTLDPPSSATCAARAEVAVRGTGECWWNP